MQTTTPQRVVASHPVGWASDDGDRRLRGEHNHAQWRTAKRRPVICAGRIASLWIRIPGASGRGDAPRAIQETSSRAVVASTATPWTRTLQPTPVDGS